MNLEALKDNALFQTIPEEIQDRIRDLRAINVGFGPGPGFAAQRHHDYPEPVHLSEALAWIEAQTSFKRAHIELEDGLRVLFDPNGFELIREPGE
jgi:hypothetical protein